MEEKRTLIYSTLQSALNNALGILQEDGFELIAEGTQNAIRISQGRPEVIEVFPSITFDISSDLPDYDLGSTVVNQHTQVTVDIWTQTSKEGDQIKISTEQAFRLINYLLVGSIDVPDPTGISHINAKFLY